MKRTPVLLILAALAFAAAAGGCLWIAGRYAPGYSVMDMFLSIGPIEKLLMILTVLLTAGALLTGLIGLATRETGPLRLLLKLTAAGCASLGVLAALYSWMTIQMAIRSIGSVRFEITAPSYAEALLALSFGLFGALVALTFHAVLGRRPH